jgi:outer membrane protein insertion porin family
MRRGLRAALQRETSFLISLRPVRLIAACLLWFIAAGVGAVMLTGPAFAQQHSRAPRAAAPARVQQGGTIEAIKAEGNDRIEDGTIRSYMLVSPGDPFDADRIDRSLKTLYATGLFQDVRLVREGSTLVVHVKENPLVNRVAFEGNHTLTDEQLRPAVQLRARSVFTPAQAEADRKSILDLYAKKGHYDATVQPEIIRLDQNRVDVVFKINDGPSTLISRIAFVGNRAFSEGRLSEVINSRESRWWRFLSSSDQYDPERLNYDKELLRKFYLKNGYIDFQVVDATSELSPDRKAFFLTFTVKEGERYRVDKVDIVSKLPKLDPGPLHAVLTVQAGDWYDGDAVARDTDAIEEAVHNLGYAFVDVRPRVTKDAEKHIVSLTYEIGEGPRVFVERIDITGNTRTQDKVIRRQFRLAEGDAFNAEKVRKTRQDLNDTQYFSGVDIQTSPGSAPDRAVLNTNVQEKATGELTLGGGYSTDAGFLIDVGLSERNLVGTGIQAGINGVLAQKRSSITASVTNPYFLDRNLAVGGDVFYVETNNLGTEPYDERRVGFDTRAGYDFSDHLHQVWSYSLVNRTVFNVSQYADFFIQDESGTTLLSQISQVLSLDYRDSRIDPHRGFVTSLGADYAGLGGDARFVRGRIDGTDWIPLDRFTGNSDWGISVGGSTGYLFNEGQQEQIIDRFFLGGDNLRGFQTGGAGPHTVPTSTQGSDSVGGRFIWTQSTELHFPLPVTPDLGLSGRAFVDLGGLTQANFENNSCHEAGGAPVACPSIYASAAPRLGAGLGISWHTAFGLINIDVAPIVLKQQYDQTQLIRFGFGTRF